MRNGDLHAIKRPEPMLVKMLVPMSPAAGRATGVSMLKECHSFEEQSVLASVVVIIARKTAGVVAGMRLQHARSTDSVSLSRGRIYRYPRRRTWSSVSWHVPDCISDSSRSGS